MDTAAIKPQMESLTITFPKVDMKRVKGLLKVMGWQYRSADYYDSPRFLQDIDEAERAIANGEGKEINSIEELHALFHDI